MNFDIVVDENRFEELISTETKYYLLLKNLMDYEDEFVQNLIKIIEIVEIKNKEELTND